MKQVIKSAVVAAIAVSAPMAAKAAPNGFQTVALSNTVFEVIPRARRDTDGYWCAAADFARRKLGAGWQQQIYVVRGYGPSEATGRKTSVQFSIAPPTGTAPQQSSISIGFSAGQSMSVQGANGLCNRRQVIN